MNVRLILTVLFHRRALRRRDHWTREELLQYQARAFADLRKHAYGRSAFYQRFHADKHASPLHELPILTKAVVMEHFDEIVTDPAVHLADIEQYLSQLVGRERFLDTYDVAGTAGSTGRRGLFLWNFREWVAVIASYNRAFDWAGSTAGLTNRVKTAVVSSTNSAHQSARVGASINSRWVPTIRLDSGDPVSSIVDRLNEWQPRMLIAYASMLRLLAEEQLAGRLEIKPKFIFSASEVLTDSTRERARRAWGEAVFNVYAATETSGIAAECSEHRGLHLFEDLIVTEVVDEKNLPVPVGEYGSRVLVTVLFSRTLPLIRYEMTDSVALSTREKCLCGRPFALIEGIQGRQQEALQLPGENGGIVTVQPVVFHHIMDQVQASGWQIIHARGELTVLLAGGEDVEESSLVAELHAKLREQGTMLPEITVKKVAGIPRTALGKAPLILSNRS